MIAYLAVYACVSMTGGNMQTLGSDIAPPDCTAESLRVATEDGSSLKKPNGFW